MKLIKYFIILVLVVIGITTACCHVQFDELGYDVLLTVRWNEDLKIGLTYKDTFAYKVIGTENLVGNSASRVEKQLAGF